MLKRIALALALLIGVVGALPPQAEAARRSTSRSYSTRSHSSSRSGGYYRGPSKPPGHYKNGMGSSHKGGTYKNTHTGNHYQKRK